MVREPQALRHFTANSNQSRSGASGSTSPRAEGVAFRKVQLKGSDVDADPHQRVGSESLELITGPTSCAAGGIRIPDPRSQGTFRDHNEEISLKI